MATRVKTARAVPSNAGIRSAYSDRILSFVDELRSEILADILTELSGNGRGGNRFAGDASPDRRYLEFLFAELKRKAKTAEGLKATQKSIRDFVAANLPRYLGRISPEAQRIARRYVMRMVKAAGRAQREALAVAGVPTAAVAEHFGAMPIKGYYLSKTAVEVLPGIIEENTNLITNLASADLANIQENLIETITGDDTYDNLLRTLRRTSGFTEKRARTVALDQTQKVSQAIQRANSESLGIKQGVWIHAPGLYTSRKTHLKFNGKIFDLDKGLYDSDVGKYVRPGECINCRCTFRPVLPEALLVGTTSKN